MKCACLHGVGLPVDAGGLLLANLAFLAGLVALYELTRNWVAEEDARRTVLYATLFPFGLISRHGTGAGSSIGC